MEEWQRQRSTENIGSWRKISQAHWLAKSWAISTHLPAWSGDKL